MIGKLTITRAGPLATIQDAGRPGALRHGISASGPMDESGWHEAGALLAAPGTSGIECTTAGLDFHVDDGRVEAAFAGGAFTLVLNGQPAPWPTRVELAAGDDVSITPGPSGNYGYIRFAAEIDVPLVLDSRATSTIAGLGGYHGRALQAGDTLTLIAPEPGLAKSSRRQSDTPDDAPIRFVWGIHADRFSADIRQAFVGAEFAISARHDRMGVRLADPAGVFAAAAMRSLVSDAVVPGDIQILGDGTPIVLMRDHQPTGGYPRIATVISADLSRFAQLRPGHKLRFVPVTVATAQDALRREGAA